MPIRLNVVLSQPAAGQRREQEIADELVGQLLGRPSMDLALIGPLESVAPTDQLMLDGLSGDFAILAWSDAETALGCLRQLGIDGRRAPHRDDPQVPSASGRRIYCFDGRVYGSAAAVIDSLAALLKDRQVVTFGLSGPGAARPSVAAEPSSIGSVTTPPSQAASPADGQLPQQGEAVAQPPRMRRPTEDDAGCHAALDALVEDLNAMDL